MSTYRKLHGRAIQAVTTDPSESVAEGQVWYNTTSDTFKSVVSTSAWSSGSSLTTGRNRAMGAGTNTAAVTAGGYAGSPTSSNLTEEYNGSGWAAANNMATGSRGGGSAGTQTAAITAGGLTAPYPSGGTNLVSQTYDGTNWTNTPAPNRINTGRANIFIGTAGVQTSALLVGGEAPAIPGVSNAVESYNGTSWSNETNYPSATYQGGIAGASEVVVTAGGQGPGGSPGPTRAESYNYDGSSWTANPNLNTTRDYMAGFGIQTSALICGGSLPPGGPANYANVEEWDGTTWTEIADLSSARRLMGSAGTAPSGMVFGGDPGTLTLTEEFNKSTNTITAAAWASGGNLNQGRINVSMGGTQTAGIVLGGHQSPGAEPAAVETYNGSAFTSGTAIGPYTGDYAAYAGSQTQGIIFGGAPYTTNTAEYDGEWAAGGSLSQGRSDLMGAGTGETSAVAMGGFSPAPTARAETEEYGGTSWTSGGSLSTGRGQGAGFGIETAALVTGGEVSGGTKQSATEEYNGSSWTSGGSLITATGDYIGGWGTQTDGVVVGGGAPGYVTTTLGYDGTSFTTRPNAANPAGRTQTAGADGSAGLRAGGGPNTTQRDGSEEFTGETSAANITDFTTS